MWKSTLLIVGTICAVYAQNAATPRNGNELVDNVLQTCADSSCVKYNVLKYLDHLLKMETDARSIKNIDNAIFKRVARLVKTHEFRMQLPSFFEGSELVYNTKDGLDITPPTNDGRALGLKKKLLFPILLLLKLKMQALMPIFVGLLYMKTMKALILSKLAIVLVIGFIAYQLIGKAGMKMPLPMTMTSMPPLEPPMSMYGPPTTTSSYEPGWEPANGGPYARIWSNSAAGSSSSSASDSAQNIAYSSYYPGSSSASTTSP